jgi:hypothetical protein
MGRTTPAAKATPRQRQARRPRRWRVAMAAAASFAAVLMIGALAWSLAGAGGTAISRPATVGNTAGIDATSTAVGKPFPDFAVTGPDGRTITNASLQGRPSLVWLTTLDCVPVQLGAPKLARLDDQLGGTAPRVLVPAFLAYTVGARDPSPPTRADPPAARRRRRPAGHTGISGRLRCRGHPPIAGRHPTRHGHALGRPGARAGDGSRGRDHPRQPAAPAARTTLDHHAWRTGSAGDAAVRRRLRAVVDELHTASVPDRGGRVPFVREHACHAGRLRRLRRWHGAGPHGAVDRGGTAARRPGADAQARAAVPAMGQWRPAAPGRRLPDLLLGRGVVDATRRSGRRPGRGVRAALHLPGPAMGRDRRWEVGLLLPAAVVVALAALAGIWQWSRRPTTESTTASPEATPVDDRW